MKIWRIALFLVILLCSGVQAAPEDSVPGWLRKVHIGSPKVFGGLALYPLIGPDRHLPSRFTLDGALREGCLRVQEVNAGGSVNQLTVENTGDRAVFVMSGEILSGARQDRVLQHDLWLPPHSGKVEIGVYCVEHGRWTYRGADEVFKSKSTLSNASVRAAAQVEKSQGAVWSSVDETNRAAGVSAPTQSLNSAYEDKHLSVEVDRVSRHFENMLEENPDMCGVMVQTGQRFVTVDIFPDRKLLHALWPKLVRSYALEGHSQPTYFRESESDRNSIRAKRRPPVDWEDAQTFLQHCQEVEASEIPHVGDGELLTLHSSRLGGEALVLREGPAHIDLFSRSHQPIPEPPHHPRPRPTVQPTPWPPAQELIRPHQE